MEESRTGFLNHVYTFQFPKWPLLRVLRVEVHIFGGARAEEEERMKKNTSLEREEGVYSEVWSEKAASSLRVLLSANRSKKRACSRDALLEQIYCRLSNFVLDFCLHPISAEISFS